MIAAGNLSLGAREIIMVQTTNGPGALTPKAALTSTIMKGSKMAAKPYTPALSAEQVRAILRYEPDTGKLYWRERAPALFSSERQCKVWNTRFAGKEAFTAYVSGYRKGAIFGQKYLAHRIIWLIQTGEWPAAEVDHKNGVRDDNRLKNLSAVTRFENMRNQKRSRKNTSGVNGVFWHEPSRKWRARIEVDGRQVHLGLFETIEEAAEARASANRKHGYSVRHGTLDGEVAQLTESGDR